MKVFADEQIIVKLEKRKGGYFYLIIPAEVVDKFKDDRQFGAGITLVSEIPP